MTTPDGAAAAQDTGRLLGVPRSVSGGTTGGSSRSLPVAERVADELRRQIVSGELVDGDELPRQEDLLARFRVSRPSLREALRILEFEGLVSVRRGKRGGSVVHRPSADTVAYTLGTVLSSQDVAVDDLSAALNTIEPQCVALCAARPDRATAVVPRLRAAHEAAAACIDDAAAFTRQSRRFHEELVACCGNQTLIVVVGALEAVWSAPARAWAERHLAAEDFPDLAYRRQGLDDHARLLDLVERGDVLGAVAEAGRHLQWAPVYTIDEDHSILSSVLYEGRVTAAPECVE